MREVEVVFPEEVRSFLSDAIRRARGNEVFFLAKVAWSGEKPNIRATITEVDLLARGNAAAVPAVIQKVEGWHLAIHNHPSGRLEPSEADMAVAGNLSDRGVGFAIISNDAARQYVVIPPFPEPRKVRARVDPEEVRAIFKPGGVLADALEGFEAREGQVAMALEVTAALNEGRVVALEAGTGVGKSFAYLVPAILWARRNREKVAVSTGTINLQEQLANKDLPLLARSLPEPFNFALIKGRNNYACRRKVADLERDRAAGRADPENDSARQIAELVRWAQESPRGSRSELGWIPPPAVWEEVMSESDKSLKMKCPHHGECFFYNAKRMASNADILIVNHHLVFADLAVRRETRNYSDHLVIPAYAHIIFDEAHHLEDVASDHFGLRFSRAGLRTRLSRLYSVGTPPRGALPLLIQRLRGEDGVAAGAISETYPSTVVEVREEVEDALFALEQALLAQSPGASDRQVPQPAEPGPAAPGASGLLELAGVESGRTAVVEDSFAGASPPPAGPRQPHAPALQLETGGLQLRYREGDGRGAFWELVAQQIDTAVRALRRLLEVNDQALAILERSRLPEPTREERALELKAFGTRLQALLVDLVRFCKYDEEGVVRWISVTPRRGRPQDNDLEFASAPIRVGAPMLQCVYEALESVIMASATLSVAGQPEYLADRLGLSLLPPGRFHFHEYASPFEFERQVLTAIPTDLPAPDAPGFARALPAAVLELLKASGGRAFVLFTSYSLLRKTHAALKSELTRLGLLPLAQGELPRSELLERFRAGFNGVLFGTDSFWEGVDVKGRALECVILTRLPFRVPSEPVQEARLEDLERRGENPFTAFTVPQAVLKFKQGFGRLIRAQTDRGVVAVLDRRIFTKPYGRTFLSSLPRTRLLKAPLATVSNAVREIFSADQKLELVEPPGHFRSPGLRGAGPPRPAASPSLPRPASVPWEPQEPDGSEGPPW